MRTDRPTDRPTDRQTDRQTDIATYRAAIAAKKVSICNLLNENVKPDPKLDLNVNLNTLNHSGGREERRHIRKAILSLKLNAFKFLIYTVQFCDPRMDHQYIALSVGQLVCLSLVRVNF